MIDFRKYNGALVLGDIHGMYNVFLNAYEYAKQNKLYIISLGDVVDYGDKPIECYLLAKHIVENQEGVFIMGNHDDKNIRWGKGNKIKIGKVLQKTLERVDYNQQVYKDLLEFYDKNSEYYINIGNCHFAHGGIKPDMWDKKDDELSKSQKEFCLYGQVDFSRTADYRGIQYHARLYNWCDDVPKGKFAILGHDRSPFKELPDFEDNLKEPLVYNNDQGGTCIFMDTGSGKGGHLSGLILKGKELEIDAFLSFES